jgi:alkaline phosphatase D
VDERNEIFDFLKDNKIEGVILLSADRHRSDAWRIERKDAYPLYEFESSRLTNAHVHKLMPKALFGYNEKQSFGLLNFDTKNTDPTVTYKIVNIDNEIIRSFTLKRSQLAH